MTDPSTQGTFRLSDGVVFRELDGEAVLLNLDSSMYFGLDPVGTRIWKLLEQHGTADAVVAAMQEEYEVEPATLRTDVSNFIASLIEKGLVVRAG